MNNKWIDLRSDTVTIPPMEMKQTMLDAVLGDDVYGDDPTVNALEAYAAEKLGKEAALFVPSGTFGNQLALLTHTRRGDEVILASDAHIMAHEVGAAAVIAGVQLRTFDIEGVCKLPVEKIRGLIREDDIHYPDTGLICLENALGNGSVVSLEDMKAVKSLAEEYNIPLHLDGARLFNAAHALQVDVKELTQLVDSANICLSKGLCAPVGSILVGNKKFIDRARKNRKLMGGGMRQAGVIAAPALYALKEMTDRLTEDHSNAKYMAQKLSEIDSVNVIEDRLAINMVFFTLGQDVIKESILVEKMQDKGIKINGTEDGEYRFVTHHGVTREDIDIVVKVLKDLL
ncbi:low-specificity L-threonine aldolase [Fusibacter sp. JL216-2]|uniref:low-specificity L-threonine aldolase n=1 Tax=Fusibacter sp. JL216-2 TaxID=3071453 RepID=UPI003D34A8F1